VIPRTVLGERVARRRAGQIGNRRVARIGGIDGELDRAGHFLVGAGLAERLAVCHERPRGHGDLHDFGGSSTACPQPQTHGRDHCAHDLLTYLDDPRLRTGTAR
jgi:hypothetical protein